MRRTLLICAIFAGSVFGYERLKGPTELLFHDKAKAFPGYTLFGVGSRTYLLDMEGRVVEVDMQGNVVWECGFFDHVVQDVDPAKPNFVGSGKSIADHPALKGRELIPQGTITERAAQGLDPQPRRRPPGKGNGQGDRGAGRIDDRPKRGNPHEK
jgi:hypothetical protein